MEPDLATEGIPPTSPPLSFAGPTTAHWKWRAILFTPSFVPPLRGVNRLKYWWGQDIWFGRWPVLKIQAALVAAAELARWLT